MMKVKVSHRLLLTLPGLIIYPRTIVYDEEPGYHT